MICVEGLDNTGKSTLCEKLGKDFPELEFHPSIGNKHDLDQIREQAYYQAEEAKVNELWDRCRFISEYVYNPVLRGRDLAFGHEAWFYFIKEYLLSPQLLIYCKRPLGKVIATFDEREQLSGVYDNLPLLNDAYNSIMWLMSVCLEQSPYKSVSGILAYDYEEKGDYDRVADAVGQYLEEVRRR
jgi:thymidylate kinase